MIEPYNLNSNTNQLNLMFGNITRNVFIFVTIFISVMIIISLVVWLLRK